MRKEWNSLVVKIGVAIILVEALALALIGGLYVNQVSRTLDGAFRSRIQVPATLMDTGLLAYNVAGNLEVLESLVGNQVMQSYMVGDDGRVLFAMGNTYLGQPLSDVPGVEAADRLDPTGAQLVELPNAMIVISPLRVGLQNQVVGYLYLKVATMQLRQQKASVMFTFGIGSLVMLVVTSGVLIYLLNSLVLRRIGLLLEVSRQVLAGDLTARLSGVFSNDEIGVLQSDVNAMVVQLEDTVRTLESRVIERTSDLERRSRQLQVVSKVGNAIVSIRDFDTLLAEVTRLISDQFGFYHVGIFLLDTTGKYAVLRAANSEGGQRMLARGHTLEVGGVGIVGYVAHEHQPRIAADVGEDAVYFDNPDLPETRSEMALPLIAGGRLLGVLDIQSKEEAVFSHEDVDTLRGLADQVAVALDNARLLRETQAAIEAQQRAYGEISRRAWEELSRTEVLAYRSDAGGDIVPLADEWLPEMIQAKREGRIVQLDDFTVAVPVKLRGESAVGVVKLRRPDDAGGWTPQQLALLETLTDRLGQALESARFYRDSQRAASREQTLREIVEQVRGVVDVDSVMRTAVREVGQALGREVFIYLTED
ncbi:MAG: GAF domain-containing protein [Anaerolineae bacterium]|nr:GAF domain-containing protein [Anaerolineae bacterium]